MPHPIKFTAYAGDMHCRMEYRRSYNTVQWSQQNSYIKSASSNNIFSGRLNHKKTITIAYYEQFFHVDILNAAFLYSREHFLADR